MPRISGPSRMQDGDDPVWAAFCAGTAPLQRPTPAKKQKKKTAEIQQSGGHHPIVAPIYLSVGEEENFSQLMGEWEAGNGRFQDPVPLVVAEPVLSAPALAALAGATAPAKPKKAATPSPLDQWHGVDAATVRKISRGQMPIDAVLDLHGLRLEEALDSVRGMVQLARMRQWRLLLVITGKGSKRMSAETPEGKMDGKIRRAIPGWLQDGQIAPHVIAAGTAHARHGGAGAFYFLLRRAARGTPLATLGVPS